MIGLRVVTLVVRLTSMCLRNLCRRKVRTSLCILGITLGVALIISVGATTGNYVTVLKEMNLFYQKKLVVITRGSFFIQAFSMGGFLQEATFEDVNKVEGVKNAVPMIVVLGPLEQEGIIQLAPSNITFGIPFGSWSILTESIPLKSGGRWPSALSSEMEVVIGPDLTLKYDLSVGTTIELNSKELRVVGVLDVLSSSSFLRGVFITSLDVAQEIFGYPNLISMIVVEPAIGVTEQELAQKIEAEVIGVNTLTGEERNDVMEPLFNDIELWSLGIGSTVSCINLVLVMVVSIINVTERRRELATLNAIGIPQVSIIRLVVTETGLMGLFGGIAGIPLGMIGAFSIFFLYTQNPISMILANTLTIVPPMMILQILVTTFTLSCIAGLLSAITILRASITESMRAE